MRVRVSNRDAQDEREVPGGVASCRELSRVVASCRELSRVVRFCFPRYHLVATFNFEIFPSNFPLAV